MKKRFAKTTVGICTGLLLLSMVFYKEHYRIPSLPSSIDSVNVGMVCSIDTNSAYLVMWQKLFLTRDQVREEYYSNHITFISNINPV